MSASPPTESSPIRRNTSNNSSSTSSTSSSSPPSGILRPSSYSNLQHAAEAPSSPSSRAQRSSLIRRSSSTVILHDEELGTVSTERFYTLAELQTHAPHAIFLQELLSTTSVNASDTTTTITTTRTSADNPLSADIQPFTILYMLWRPDDDTVETAEAFVQLLQGAISSITEATRIVPSEDSGGELLGVPLLSSSSTEAESSSNSAHREDSRMRQHQEQQLPTNNTSGNDRPNNALPTTSLYVVVDRVAPRSRRQRPQSTKSNENDNDPDERELAHQLVRQAASILRDQDCEGISVFLSNHTRAAPGLEACMNAVSFGAKDRRRHAAAPQSTDDTCSFIGLIATSPQDFLGVDADDQTVTDAAQNVHQACYCAEWNGYGTLTSFAKRAHTQWCLHHGVPIPKPASHSKKSKRSRGRRKNHQRHVDEQALDKAIQAFLYDFGVIAVCLVYIIFHYGHDLWKAFDAWMEQLIEEYLGISVAQPPPL